jgi:hypothetical protein
MHQYNINTKEITFNENYGIIRSHLSLKIKKSQTLD